MTALVVAFAWLLLFAWNPGSGGSAEEGSEEGPSVLLAQPSIPQEVKQRADVLEIFQTQLALTREGLVTAEALLGHAVRGALLGGPYVPPVPDGFETPATSDGQVRARERFGPDLVVWPETMLLWRDGEAPVGESYREGEDGVFLEQRDRMLDTSLRVQALTAGELERRGTSLLAGQLYVIADAKGGYSERNAMHLFDRAFGHVPVARYDKMKLAPGGEYIPLIDHVPYSEEIRAWVKGKAGYLPDLDPGEAPGVLHLARRDGAEAWALGAAICMDNVYEDVFRGAVRRGADAHVVLSNEGWFRGSAEQDHMLAFSSFRAVETGRAVLRATNTGISALFSADGRQIRTLRDADGADRDIPGWMWVRLPISEGQTPYARGGWWLAPGSTLLLLLLLAWRGLVRLVRPRTDSSSSPEEARKVGNRPPPGL